MDNLGYTGDASKRNVKPVPKWALEIVPKPKGIVKTIVSGQEDVESDTIPFMVQRIKATLPQTKALAKKLQGPGIEQTARSNYNFITDHIKYTLDKDGSEQVRDPAAMIHDGKGDCDCFVMTISSLLLNQGIPHFLTIMEEQSGKGWSHIYVTVPKNGRLSKDLSRDQYFVIDPVVHRFNYEATSVNKKHFPMSLQSLQGIRNQPCRTESEQKSIDALKQKKFYTPTMQLELQNKVDTKKLLTENGIPFEDNTETATVTVSTPTGKLSLPTVISSQEATQLKQSISDAIAVDAEVIEEAKGATNVEFKPNAIFYGGLLLVLGIGISYAIGDSKPKKLSGVKRKSTQKKYKVVRV